jgi:DNA-binding transcriptional ArsR family regulator
MLSQVSSKPEPCSKMLKALADDTRWRMVKVLLDETLSVTELTGRLKVSQYNVSKHARILREAGIIETEKEGRVVRCFITPAFRRRVGKNEKQLDLGCCTFRFDRP